MRQKAVSLVFAWAVFFSIAGRAQFSQQGPKLIGTGSVGAAVQGVAAAIAADGNTAVVEGPGDNSNFGAARVFVVLPSADLAITKSVANEPPFNAGASMTYTISVMNNGPDAASGVTVTDTLPAGTTF